MKRKGTQPGKYRPPSAIRGERDDEIGRRLEKGKPTDPLKRKQAMAQAGKKQEEEDWKLKLEEMEKADKEKSQKQIKQLTQFINEVAQEERERQQEMRERVQAILDNRMKKGKEEEEEELPPLEEPSTKSKRGGFMQKLKKKGKGAMAEAKGMITKGGG